jgi:hypothetical protein
MSLSALPEGALPLGPDNYYTKGVIDNVWVGIIEYHRTPQGWCGGWVPFNVHPHANDAHWTVNSLEPLDLSPSLLCTICGNHGFIREGRWVPA